MPLDQATGTLQDTTALWSIDAVSPQAVVRCACDALIAGLDSPSLRILAGLTRAEADYHVLDILPAALAEIGLDFYPRGSRGGQEAAARTTQPLGTSCPPCAATGGTGIRVPFARRRESPGSRAHLDSEASRSFPAQVLPATGPRERWGCGGPHGRLPEPLSSCSNTRRMAGRGNT
jgi:hypothetical protein